MAKFYTFNQNNPGGDWVFDDGAGICTDVIIEAKSAKQANKKLAIIASDSINDYCPCCGQRWHNANEDDATEIPSIYGESVFNAKEDLFRKSAFIHYLDGRIEKVIFKKE